MSSYSGKKVKVGVVGCGVVATAYYLPYLMKMNSVELTAVCDRFETRISACARLFGVKQQYPASIITKRKELLPHVSADGWFHLPERGIPGKSKWPQPTPGAFNYYHQSTQHLIDCILDDREPLANVDWGLHITEMMAGAVESYTSGKRYEMTTTLDY